MEQQGETSSSFVNMNTWGVTPGEQEWQRTDWTSVLSAVPVHQAQSQLEPLLQRDSQRENADQAQTELFASQEQCDDVTSEDLIGKAREVLNDVSKKADDFIEWTIKTQLKCVENDYQIQSLASKQDIGKKQHLQIQMGNEQLSNEMENILSSSDEIITKVVNTWEVCNHLTEYYDNLATFKSEEIETAKNELTVQNDKLCAQVKCLSEYCKALIDDYQKEVSTLKNQVQEDRRSRIAEVEAANETYIKLQLNLKEEESKLELEEKRHSSLTLEYEDITRGMEEETLKFKEEMEKINGLSHTLFSNNSLLESEINCMKNKKQELTQLLENTMTTRDSYRDQCAVLEKELQVINNRGKELTEELTAEKEKLSTLEIENRELKTKKEGSDKKKMELLEQKLFSENELKTEKAKLEEIKVKDEFAEQELEDLKLKMKNIQLESEEIYVAYKSEISKLENSLSEILKELNIKATDNKQQKIKKDELTKQCEASDIEMKQLASEIQAKDEEALDVTKKLETLNNGIQEEQLKTEELNQAIILKESEVELAKNELERKRKDSQDYKKEMSDAVSSLKQQIQDVKTKQDTTVSECNKKRESIMKYLDECRNNSVSKSNEIENEITAQKNENSSVKDKLNVVKAEKDSFEKNTAMQIELLENSIKQLKEEIEKCDLIPSAPAEEPLSSDSESIGSRIVHPSIQTFQVPPTKNISMSQTYQPPRAVKSSHTYQVPPVQPRPIRKKTFDESDSDHSSVDFSDYINRMSSTVARNAAQSVPPKRRKFFSQNTSQPAMLQNERMQVHFHKSIKPTPKSRPPSPKVSDNSDADDLLSML